MKAVLLYDGKRKFLEVKNGTTKIDIVKTKPLPSLTEIVEGKPIKRDITADRTTLWFTDYDGDIAVFRE